METLQIGGVDCNQLAEEFGTPLYIYDETKIINQAEDAVSNFTAGDSAADFKTEVVYASKAFSSTALFRLLAAAGMGLDVVSGGELYCAIKAGVDMSKVYFHGNNKSDEEIDMALEAGVGYFVIDNVMECERLIAAAERKQRETKALLRINPGISAHTHEYIMTATPDSKFGVHIKDRKHIEDVIQKLSRSSFVKHSGFHSHIGSQIMGVSSFEKAIEAMISFLAEVKREYGLDNMELSIGGGFGIRYTDEDEPVPIGEMCRALAQCAAECAKREGIKISKLITEPGRAIVGEAGYTLYTIGDMKKSGDKNYIFVDGGMSDNIRPALYSAEYTADLIKTPQHEAGEPFAKGSATENKKAKQGELQKTYCVAGKNCESGDVLIKSISLPEAASGDLLLMRSTGAYGYSMANNYNRLGRPAVVFAGGGKARLIIRRETYEDQYKLEV